MSINQPDRGQRGGRSGQGERPGGGDRDRGRGGRRPGRPYDYDYGYGYQEYCPYGGTPYYAQADTDVYTLANQFGISPNTIISYNPGLSLNSTIGAGQTVCLPRNY
ncbi:MAG TPA: hypothetical protein DDW65_23505 [Firmicutes bacterium]|jgi:hypothetical protein|nr:hypothetical protein [Bacillota bacterium]